MHLPTYLALLTSAEQGLATSYRLIGDAHPGESDVRYTCGGFARQCGAHVDALAPIVSRYEDRRQPAPDRLHPPELTAARDGGIGLLRDLQDLYQLAALVDITWTLVGQAASGARDRLLLDVVAGCHAQVTAQQAWLRTRMQAAAPQLLLIGP